MSREESSHDALAEVESVAITPVDGALVARARENTRRSLSDASRRAYASDWARFTAWCAAHGLRSLPSTESVIVTYLTAASEGYRIGELAVAPLGYASLQRLYAAVRVHNADAGAPLGVLLDVRKTLENVGRTHGTAPKQKRALLLEDVTGAVDRLPRTYEGVRDRALLLLGWTIGQRRSNLAALNVDDLVFSPQGVEVILRRSKTDQLGRGRSIGVERIEGPHCPVAAAEAWLKASGAREGAFFRVIGERDGRPMLGGRMTDKAVAGVVKKAAASLGKDPLEYGGHSLRRGFVSSSAKAGNDVTVIMRTTGHKSVAQVQTYIEHENVFDGHVGASLLAGASKPEQIHPTTGQPLVNRRRIASIAYRRDGKPADMKWLREQVAGLRARKVAEVTIVQVLLKLGVRKGDGSPISGDDTRTL